MNRIKSILSASLLTLALSSATFAGNIYQRNGNIYQGPAEVSGNIYQISIEIVDAVLATRALVP